MPCSGVAVTVDADESPKSFALLIRYDTHRDAATSDPFAGPAGRAQEVAGSDLVASVLRLGSACGPVGEEDWKRLMPWLEANGEFAIQGGGDFHHGIEGEVGFAFEDLARAERLRMLEKTIR